MSFRCVAPLDRACRSVPVSQEGQEATFNVAGPVKVMGGEHLLLQDAEDNLDLIQPRGMDRKPMNANVEAQPEGTYPRRQLLGRMGRSVIKDQMEYAHPFAPEAGGQQPPETLAFSESAAVQKH